MPYTPALLPLLQKALASTSFCVDDMEGLGLGDWHASVLLDNTQYLSSFDPLAFNDRNLVGDTPLDIAYRLNRIALIEKLEALGALGDKQLRDWKGLGSFMPHDKYMHLPARQGKIKTLETRFRLGGSLNHRDVGGNTPIHWLAINGHFKAVKYFTDNYNMFELDMNAKNNEGNRSKSGHPQWPSRHSAAAVDPGDRQLHQRYTYLARDVGRLDMDVTESKRLTDSDRVGATRLRPKD